MTIEKIARKHRSILERCHNGCKAGNVGGLSEMGYRVASHRAWILGRPTPLCDVCAKAWPRMWAESLGPVEQDKVAA